MKLIIEIPKKVVDECQEVYATQKCYGVKASEFETIIANGKSLSEIVAKIKSDVAELSHWDKMPRDVVADLASFNEGVDLVLSIIDKYINGEGDKK